MRVEKIKKLCVPLQDSVQLLVASKSMFMRCGANPILFLFDHLDLRSP